jgi:hypothetical protein
MHTHSCGLNKKKFLAPGTAYSCGHYVKGACNLVFTSVQLAGKKRFAVAGPKLNCLALNLVYEPICVVDSALYQKNQEIYGHQVLNRHADADLSNSQLGVGSKKVPNNFLQE